MKSMTAPTRGCSNIFQYASDKRSDILYMHYMFVCTPIMVYGIEYVHQIVWVFLGSAMANSFAMHREGIAKANASSVGACNVCKKCAHKFYKKRNETKGKKKTHRRSQKQKRFIKPASRRRRRLPFKKHREI